MSEPPAVTWFMEDAFGWIESDVIAISCHPLGWEFLVEGEDGEPTTDDAFLVHGDDLLTVCWEAREIQARQIIDRRKVEDAAR
jgi:hypothetical protein